MKRTIVITGGAGFIGSHVVRLFVNKYPDYKIINVDKLTYAGNLANLRDIESRPNYRFVKMDICDFEAFYQLMQDEHVDGIIHLAAESHVDRSIKDPFTFARTNVMGTLSLLQAAKLYWEQFDYVMPSHCERHCEESEGRRGNLELETRIKELMALRSDTYEKTAHIIIDTDGKSVEAVASEIISILY